MGLVRCDVPLEGTEKIVVNNILKVKDNAMCKWTKTMNRWTDATLFFSIAPTVSEGDAGIPA